MEKYKVLLIGRNKILIGDFFAHLEEYFEMQTSSMRNADITSHIKYFRPDVLIYCMNKEEKERLEVAASIKPSVEEYHTTFVLTGDAAECEQFKHMSGMGELILRKPIMARTIKDRVVELLETKAAAAAEAEERERRAEMLIHPPEETPEAEVQYIPRTQPVPTAVQMPEAPKAQPAPEKSDVQPVTMAEATSEKPRKHVLVVDDDPMLLKLIKEHLKESYTVATAINGTVALKFLENKRTDMILLDYEMPGMNGADVLEQIRKTPGLDKLPVVFLTGVKDRTKIKRLVELKPQGYLLKPIEREKLLKSIKCVIGQ